MYASQCVQSRLPTYAYQRLLTRQPAHAARVCRVDSRPTYPSSQIPRRSRARLRSIATIFKSAYRAQSGCGKRRVRLCNREIPGLQEATKPNASPDAPHSTPPPRKKSAPTTQSSEALPSVVFRPNATLSTSRSLFPNSTNSRRRTLRTLRTARSLRRNAFRRSAF